MSIIYVLLFLIGITFVSTYRGIKYPGFEEHKSSVYEYKKLSNINYEVLLKPNIVYNNSSLPEGQIYVTEFVDYLDAHFRYEFMGEKSSEIKGEYKIIAEVKGYTIENKEEKDIWTKEYTLLNSTEFSEIGKRILIEEKVSIDLDKYNEFVKLVTSESKIGLNSKLIVSMIINMDVTTDHGKVQETINPTLVIPLNVGYFSIDNLGTIYDVGSIDEIKNVKLPVEKQLILTYVIILVIFISVLISMKFLTTNGDEDDNVLKIIKMIFKQHGNRLVAITNELDTTYENMYSVKGIEDLVKIADEVEKPIIYKYRNNIKEILEFYVLDSPSIYVFDLNQALEADNRVIVESKSNS